MDVHQKTESILPADIESKIELRRYLAGVPYSHRRLLSQEETKALRREMSVGYGLLALISCCQIAFLVAGSAWFGAVLLAGPSLMVACYYAPHWRSLKSGKVHAYIGRLQDLRSSDAVQKHLARAPGFSANIDRHVEVLALGDGSRLWRVEGLSVGHLLASVEPIEIAIIPDMDEHQARPLTYPERKEIELRIREFLSFKVVWRVVVDNIWKAVGATFACVLCLHNFALNIFLGCLLICFLGELTRQIPKICAAFRLRSDLRTGIVKDGRLASGTPWVTNGEPAAWRLGWTKEGADPKALR